MIMSRLFLGIIPANTGRIMANRREGNICGDHPREYGENVETGHSIPSIRGSSPRIRGEYVSEHQDGMSLGIIPANTGRIR